VHSCVEVTELSTNKQHHHHARTIINTQALLVAMAVESWIIVDPSTWDVPPLRQLKPMQEDLLQHYDCTDQPAAAQQAPPSAQAAALLPTRAQTRSLSPQAPRTVATANSSSRNSTASTRHSSGVRFPPRRVPALRTSRPLGPGPFRRNAVSPSSSPRNGPSTRPSTSATRARVLRSSYRSTCLRSTRPRSRNPLSAWK
jgi:hypothetical protein